MLREYRVVLVRDTAKNRVVAEIPTLSIADFGADTPEALSRLRDMLAFHLECLQGEGKPIPEESASEEGLYLRVKVPARAA